MHKRWLATLILAFLSAEVAQAQERPVMITSPRASAPRVAANSQYAVEIRCSPKGGSLTDPSDYFRSRNRSLFVVIAPNVPSTADQLPANVLAAVRVYSIGRDKTTKQQLIADDRQCSKDFLINGTSQVGFLVTENWIDDYSDSTFGQVLSGAMALISPLFSLFTGDALPALVTGKIANIGAVQSATQGILSALNRGVNRTHPPIRNLRQGTYRIASQYADVTIKIRPVPSIVLDSNPAFKNDLKGQINAASIKLDGQKIPTSCRGARYAVFSLGFRSPTDLAFGLAHLSAHAGFDIKDSVTCLTREYGTIAATADQRFWGSFPPEFRIKAADLSVLDPKPPGQPAWAEIEPTLDTLVVALARYGRNEPPPELATAALAKLLTAQLALVDNTAAIAVGGPADPVDRFAALDRLKQKGYIRFGCYAPTDGSTGQQVDGATSMFLVFKSPSDAPSTTIDSALVIRPQFEGKLVRSMLISDNRAWIVATLKARDYACNGFEVKKPGAETVR